MASEQTMKFAPNELPTRLKGRHARGFSLLEVLIALVILSVGLLGLAALQAEGLRGSSSALQRTTAVSYVSDIADRMRSNRDALSDYVVTMDGDGEDQGCVDTHSSGTAVPANDCTLSNEMADNDVFIWKVEMRANGYDGSIAAVGGVANQFIVTVAWSDRTLAAGNDQTYTTNIQF